MFEFGNNNKPKPPDSTPAAGSTTPGSGPKPPDRKVKKWRATKSCTWQGKFVKEGTIVFAEEMDNPHFEEVVEDKAVTGKEPK